jgi:hypothetical protein
MGHLSEPAVEEEGPARPGALAPRDLGSDHDRFPHEAAEEYEASAAFYCAKATEAFERANTALFAKARVSFLQIAESYAHLAGAVVDMRRKMLGR